MRLRRLFSNIITFILVTALLFSLMHFTTFAKEENQITETTDSDYSVTTTATLSTDSNSSAENPTKKIMIESYLTNKTNTTVEIKPCDIIFIMDQSKWMNTEEDKGAQRAAIIEEMKTLLSSLEETTTGGEHRVAIAGYGRLNMSANTDPYSASIYPGTRASGSGISLNTGYYTTDGFITQNGWSDIKQSSMTGDGLPQMAASYKAAMTYDNAFMTLDEADTVLNTDTMLAWYAGASRMDAGLTIAEQLATVANAYASAQNEDRNLIVCLLSSSLPIQNTASSNLSTIRTAAVCTAAKQLKSLGATIFAFGDYHASGKTMAGDIQDTEDNFDYYMQQLCTKPDYFYSFSDFSNVTDALNAMITKITIVAAGEAEMEHTIAVQDITSIESEDQHTFTWRSLLDYYGTNASYVLNNTMAQVAYYYFDSYDSDGNAVFEATPYLTSELSLSTLASTDSDQLTYTTSLIPIPAPNEKDTDGSAAQYGTKIVITIASPVTVTYQWASNEVGYAPDNADLPDTEIVVLGKAHRAATVKKKTDDAYDAHYEFAGWYTDKACTAPYTGTEIITGDLTLYGKWEKYVLIEYYWNYPDTKYASADSEDKVTYGETPTPFTPELAGYTFDGWYTRYSFTDNTYTYLYTPEPMTEDLTLYAKWLPNADTVYTVHYYQQNPEGDDYTEVTADAQTCVGTTDTDIAQITMAYDGFTLNHITYESSNYAAQNDPLPIQGDGSLVVRVYYDRTATNVPENNWGIRVTLTDDTTSKTPLSNGQFALYSTQEPESDLDTTTAFDTDKATLTIGNTTWYLVGVKTTENDGTVCWENLTQDEYYVIELTAPTGYDLPESNGQIVSSVPGEIVDVPVINGRSYIAIPTGISMPDILLPLGIVLTSIVGLILLFLRRRKKLL